jgi:hypothetical protein
MEDSALSNAALASEIRSLANGVRLLACVTVLAVAVINCRNTLLIGSYEKLLADLPAQGLPYITLWLFKLRLLWIAIAFLLPLLAFIGAWKIRSHQGAFACISAVLVLLLIQLSLVSIALISPMQNLMRAMSN